MENPPLLIVSDMVRFRIRTNWTNSVSRTHEAVWVDSEAKVRLPVELISDEEARKRWCKRVSGS